MTKRYSTHIELVVEEWNDGASCIESEDYQRSSLLFISLDENENRAFYERIIAQATDHFLPRLPRMNECDPKPQQEN